MRDIVLRPATRLPPPLIYALVLFSAWRLDRIWPWSLPGATSELFGYIAWSLIGLGIVGFTWALGSIWQHRTTVNPYKGASTLVTSGPFAFSRNPIYLFDWLVYAGVTMLLRSVWPLLLAPAVWALMRYAVIAHEENHLRAKFGEVYIAYQARVRRWL